MAAHRGLDDRGGRAVGVGQNDRDEFESTEGAGRVENIRLQGSGRNHRVWALAGAREAHDQVQGFVPKGQLAFRDLDGAISLPVRSSP